MYLRALSLSTRLLLRLLLCLALARLHPLLLVSWSLALVPPLALAVSVCRLPDGSRKGAPMARSVRGHRHRLRAR